MDALDLLRTQHRALERVLERLRAASDSSVRVKHRLIAELGDLLAIHHTLEERIFYPAVNRASTEDLLLRFLEEHLSVKRVLADLLRIDEWLPTFGAKVEVLEEQLRSHILAEETLLFPHVLLLVPVEEREELGARMEREFERTRRRRPRFDLLTQTDEAAPLE